MRCDLLQEGRQEGRIWCRERVGENVELSFVRAANKTKSNFLLGSSDGGTRNLDIPDLRIL